MRTLTELIVEVDARPDELVVFEDDDCAGLHLGYSLEQAARILAGVRPATQDVR